MISPPLGEAFFTHATKQGMLDTLSSVEGVSPTLAEAWNAIIAGLPDNDDRFRAGLKGLQTGLNDLSNLRGDEPQGRALQIVADAIKRELNDKEWADFKSRLLTVVRADSGNAHADRAFRNRVRAHDNGALAESISPPRWNRREWIMKVFGGLIGAGGATLAGIELFSLYGSSGERIQSQEDVGAAYANRVSAEGKLPKPMHASVVQPIGHPGGGNFHERVVETKGRLKAKNEDGTPVYPEEERRFAFEYLDFLEREDAAIRHDRELGSRGGVQILGGTLFLFGGALLMLTAEPHASEGNPQEHARNEANRLRVFSEVLKMADQVIGAASPVRDGGKMP